MSRTVARRIQSARQDNSAGVTGRPLGSVARGDTVPSWDTPDPDGPELPAGTGVAVSVVIPSSAPSRPEGGAQPQRADRARVDRQPAAAGWRGQRRQLRAPAVELSGRHVEVDGAGPDVDADDVAVADQPE